MSVHEQTFTLSLSFRTSRPRFTATIAFPFIFSPDFPFVMARKTPVTPPLYNPTVVLFASLLFTPVFGGLLQAQNWEALGQADRARASRFWVRTSLWLIALYLGMQLVFRNEPIINYLGPYFLLVLWGSWVVTGAWKQLGYFRDHVPTDYPKRPLGRPLLLGGFGWLLYFMISVTMALGLYVFGLDTKPTLGSEESTGVIISIPEGATEPVVKPLPPKPEDQAQ